MGEQRQRRAKMHDKVRRAYEVTSTAPECSDLSLSVGLITLIFQLYKTGRSHSKILRNVITIKYA